MDIKIGLKDIKLFMRMSLFDLSSKGLDNFNSEHNSKKWRDNVLRTPVGNKIIMEEELRDTDGIQDMLSLLDSKDTRKDCPLRHYDKENVVSYDISSI